MKIKLQRTDTEVLRARLEERVLLDLARGLGAEGGGGGLLAGGFAGLGLVIETNISTMYSQTESGIIDCVSGALTLALNVS